MVIPSHVIRHVFYCNLFKVKIPSDSIIYWKCRFFRPQKVKIGHNSVIGNDAFLDGREQIYIGNNVNIDGEVRSYTSEHDIKSPTFGTSSAPVHIKDNVYIRTRVTILLGITKMKGQLLLQCSCN